MTTPAPPQTSCIIRPLSRSDLDATAAIHQLAFPHAAISQLGHSVARRYHQSLSERSDVTAFGAFVAGRLAGYCFAGTSHDVEGAFLRENLLYVSSRLMSKPTLLCQPFIRSRIGAGLRFLRSTTPRAPSTPAAKVDEAHLTVRLGPSVAESLTILYVAVDPRHQRRGLGRALLEHCEDVARLRGFRQLDLSVYLDNTRAIEFYEDAGWQREHRHGEWQGYMFKPLFQTP